MSDTATAEQIEKDAYKQNKSLGIAIPDFILNKPELIPGLEVFFEAFNRLDSQRSHALALTKIPCLDIMDYSERCGYDWEMTQDMVDYIMEMDSANLEYLRKKQAK